MLLADFDGTVATTRPTYKAFALRHMAPHATARAALVESGFCLPGVSCPFTYASTTESRAIDLVKRACKFCSCASRAVTARSADVGQYSNFPFDSRFWQSQKPCPSYTRIFTDVLRRLRKTYAVPLNGSDARLALQTFAPGGFVVPHCGQTMPSPLAADGGVSGAVGQIKKR